MNDFTDAATLLRIDGFDAFRRIGSGGFSSVYSAHQAKLGRDVAVKVLHADFSSEVDRRTFERECQALGQLSRHPNIVTVYSEAFTVEGRPCIVMELYHGNYRERIDSTGPVPIPELLALGVKIAGALQVAHDSGILHRDLKPHNIFQSDYGEPALGDFGISTIDDERSISAATGLSVAYAAPEVLEDSAATASSDVYSLAATLYHLAEGAAPFHSPRLRATVKRILTEAPPSLSSSDAPPGLSRVLATALAKEPGDRFESAAAFGESLRDLQAMLGLDRTEMPLRRGSGGEPTGRATPTGAIPARRPPATPPAIEQTVQRVAPISTHRTRPDGRADAPEAPAPTARTERVTPAAPAQVVESEQTIRRDRKRPHRPPTVEAPAESVPSSTRRRLGAGLGLLAVIGVTGAVLTTTGGDDDEPITTTTAVTVFDDAPVVLVSVETPTNVTVTESDDGTAVVGFAAVADVEEYLLRSVFPSADVGIQKTVTNSDEDTGESIVDAACWVVLARGPGGQLSDPSEPVCVTD